MGRIQEMQQKIKEVVDAGLTEWGLLAIILLVGVATFGLGRLSASEEVKPPVAIGEAATASKPAGTYPGGLVVASRSGSVYYYPWCSGASKILPANQVWFADEAGAKSAGYAPSKSCKGLTQ